MAVLIHVLIAVTSLLFTAVVFFAPSKVKLRVSYALVVLTLSSGTYLVMSTGAPMLQACMSGLFYLGIVLFGLVSARHKLASAKNKID